MSRSQREPSASRPEPAGYFLDAASGRGLLEWPPVVERLSAARNYWVSTSGADGSPHCMPVWGVWVDGEFLFSTSPISRKARNLGKNPRAVVHLESADQVVVIEGVARELRDGESIGRFLEAYNPKYSWDFTTEQLSAGGVYAVRPRKAFAWLDSQGEGFSGTATRWTFPD
jgi:nitroimidazol reductase NimA-like FMN-containing flavoprotein (pyridoxamine 5'-phosphate oxidase superfamily)